MVRTAITTVKMAIINKTAITISTTMALTTKIVITKTMDSISSKMVMYKLKLVHCLKVLALRVAAIQMVTVIQQSMAVMATVTDHTLGKMRVLNLTDSFVDS